MAKIKFALKMADGAEVRTLDQLREHFDLASVLGYYSNGRLYDWLKSRNYDEAEKLKALNPSSANFQRDLCEVLGVSHPETGNPDLSLSDIAARNGRLERLKQFTVDDSILAAVDRVAFTQEEMETLLAEDKCTSDISESRGISSSTIGKTIPQSSFLTSVPVKRIIYLCGDQFIIPGDVGEITYIGVNGPLIQFDRNISALGIDIDGVDFDFDGYADDNDIIEQFHKTFMQNPELGAKLLQKSAERGSVSAQIILGDCYASGFGVEPNVEETVKWYRKAAEQGNAEAQNSLGIKYWKGEGIGQNYEYAYRWFLRSAKQGYFIAQYNLGICYGYGKGVKKDEEEAIKWLQKALDQGYERAKSELMELMPKLSKFSDVILYAVGGTENLIIEAKMDTTTSSVDILVDDRHKIKTTVLEKYEATDVWIERKLYTYKKIKDPSPMKILRGLGGVLKNEIKMRLADAPPDLPDWEVEEETVSEDLGGGWVHMRFDTITSEMEEDFNSNIKPQCRTSAKEALRDSELLLERLHRRF